MTTIQALPSNHRLKTLEVPHDPTPGELPLMHHRSPCRKKIIKGHQSGTTNNSNAKTRSLDNYQAIVRSKSSELGTQRYEQGI